MSAAKLFGQFPPSEQLEETDVAVDTKDDTHSTPDNKKKAAPAQETPTETFVSDQTEDPKAATH